MTESRKYTNAPVALALIEVKHPVTELSRGQALGMKPALRSTLPFHREDDQIIQMFEMGPGGGRTSQTTARMHLFESRTRRTRLTCGPDSTTIETSEYNRWPELLEQLYAGLLARADVSEIDGITRLGLRYIDEIRVPSPSRPAWGEWIVEAFLPPDLSETGLEPMQQNSVVQYGTGETGVTATVRHGAVFGPPAVSGDLRPNPPEPGHYFLLDTDVAWEVPVGVAVPQLDPPWVRSTLEGLHEHASSLFESILTDRLRNEVLL